MPIYEYHCSACGRDFEVWQKISEAPASKCEHCGASQVARLISSTSFHLKGGGWYVTDYARKGSSSSDKSSGSSSDSGSKKD